MSYIHPDQIIGKQQFSPEEVAETLGLVRLVEAHDGVDSKLDEGAYRFRPEGQTNDFYYYENGQLLGYLSIFSMESTTAEINGFVHPEHRRKGIFRALVAAACDELKRRGTGRILFTVDKVSESGKGFVEAVGAEYRFSEYSMGLKEEKAYNVTHADLKLRPATEADFEFMVHCSSSAFGDPVEMTRELLIKTGTPDRKSYIAELGNERIGLMRVLETGDTGAYLHGFSILPEHQGRGYGRQILGATVQMLKEQGRVKQELDVEVDNANALGLYQSCGFETTCGYDFYEVTPQKCDITAPVRNQLTAYNNRDIDAFIACYAEDSVVEDGVGNVTMQGTKAMYESYARMFESSPDLHCHLASRTIVGNYILDEERVTGRAGRGGQSHVVAVYRVENGLIQHVRFLR